MVLLRRTGLAALLVAIVSLVQPAAAQDLATMGPPLTIESTAMHVIATRETTDHHEGTVTWSVQRTGTTRILVGEVSVPSAGFEADVFVAPPIGNGTALSVGLVDSLNDPDPALPPSFDDGWGLAIGDEFGTYFLWSASRTFVSYAKTLDAFESRNVSELTALGASVGLRFYSSGTWLDVVFDDVAHDFILSITSLVIGAVAVTTDIAADPESDVVLRRGFQDSEGNAGTVTWELTTIDGVPRVEAHIAVPEEDFKAVIAFVQDENMPAGALNLDLAIINSGDVVVDAGGWTVSYKLFEADEGIRVPTVADSLGSGRFLVDLFDYPYEASKIWVSNWVAIEFRGEPTSLHLSFALGEAGLAAFEEAAVAWGVAPAAE